MGVFVRKGIAEELREYIDQWLDRNATLADTTKDSGRGKK